MASALSTSCDAELNELVTCGVCLCEFDTDNRKPKFLPCSHTICLSCLKEINRNYMVACPFCRNISTQIHVANLANNSYALQMLKFKEKKHENTLKSSPLKGPSWCFTCGTVTKDTCTTPDHSLVNLTADTIKNMEAFISLKEDLQTMKNKGANKLAMAIHKRQEIKEHLDFLTKSFKSTMEEIDELQDENNLILTQLVSTLEGNGPKSLPATGDTTQEIEDFFLSGLESLMNDSLSPDDTADALKIKLNKSIEMFEEQFHEATAKASEYEFQMNTKIKIILLDEMDQPIPTFPLLEGGFCLAKKKKLNASVRQDLNLLSHLVFSLLRKQKISTKAEAIASAVPSASQGTDPVVFAKSALDNTKSGMNKALSFFLDSESFAFPFDSPTSGPSGELNSAIPLPLSNKFILGQSIFIFRLFQSGALKGEIHIQPVITFHPDFMNILGINCFKTPKHFCNSIEKAVSGVFVLFPMARPQFQPVLPDMVAKFPGHLPSNEMACSLGDVGVNTISTCDNAVTGWSFLFPLENYRDPKFAMHLKTLPSARLFGKVLHLNMLDAIGQLCCTSRSGRTGYSVTLESR